MTAPNKAAAAAPKKDAAPAKAPKGDASTIEVIALKRGFYGGSMISMGAVFRVGAEEKGSWFTPTKPIQGAKVDKLDPDVQAAVAANAAASTSVKVDPASGKLDDMTAGSGQHVDLA